MKWKKTEPPIGRLFLGKFDFLYQPEYKLESYYVDAVILESNGIMVSTSGAEHRGLLVAWAELPED